MYHSITFGMKNTWDDWHLIPSTRPVVAPPQANSSVVTIPGTNGAIDTTELLTGFTTFQNRSGTFDFYVDNDYWPDWITTYNEIMTYLHGKYMRCYLEDDPGFYYEGRFFVTAWNTGANYSRITIQYNVHPYKRHIHPIIVPEFEVISDTPYTLTIVGMPEPVIPTIVITFPPDPEPEPEEEEQVEEAQEEEEEDDDEDMPSMSVAHTYDGVTKTFDLENGSNIFPRLILREGVNTLVFTGEGTVNSITYTEGTL